MQSQGHDVMVMCVEDDYAESVERLVWADDTYEDIPVRRLWFDRSTAPDPPRWEYDNPWIGTHVRHVLTKRRPDVFHLIGGYLMTGSTLRAAQEMRVPTVVTLTDFWFFCPRIQMWRSNGRRCDAVPEAGTCVRCLAEERRRYRLPGQIAPGIMGTFWKMHRGAVARIEERRRFLRQTLNQTDRIISPSRFLHRFSVQSGIAPEKMAFVRQGRDFPYGMAEKAVRPSDGYLRVGYLGKVAPHKGAHVLLSAARRLPDAPMEIHIYGDAAGYPSYEARIRRAIGRDRRLHWEGPFSKEELPEVLGALDVIVIPSLWFENSPNVILEAFGGRTPVVVSDIGGMAELVHHEVNGLHFGVGDEADLARQLRRLVEEPDLLALLRRGIPAIKPVAKEMEELVQIYDRVRADSR
jgi:glycosyltransferase involved in cell wall biosynthesis